MNDSCKLIICAVFNCFFSFALEHDGSNYTQLHIQNLSMFEARNETLNVPLTTELEPESRILQAEAIFETRYDISFTIMQYNSTNSVCILSSHDIVYHNFYIQSCLDINFC